MSEEEDPYLKCISCYEVLAQTKQFMKFRVVTEWFFSHHYQKSLSLLSKSPTIQTASHLIEIFYLLMKINHLNVEDKLNESEVMQLMNPILVICVTLLSNSSSSANP